MKYDALGYRFLKIDVIYIYWLSSTQFQLSHKISFCNVLDLSICRSWINSMKKTPFQTNQEKNTLVKAHLFFDYLRSLFEPTWLYMWCIKNKLNIQSVVM